MEGGRARPKKSNQDPKPKKKIAIVGAGVIGLTTAYFLAQNPQNQVTVIERNEKPYQYTSYQNGCYFHTQNCESWINKPFTKFLATCYGDNTNAPSQTYILSMLQNPKTLLKFGYLWLFKQPNPDDFAKTIQPLLRESENMVRDFMRDEGIKAEAIGYRPDVK